MKISILLFLLIINLRAGAQTAEQIINTYIRFIGGEKNWIKIKSLISSGEYDYGGVSFPFTTYAKAPHFYKFIVPFNNKFYAQGFDGEIGWKIDAFKNETKPTLPTGKAALAMANEVDVMLESPFINYKVKRHQLKYEGTERFADKDFYKVRLLKKTGEIETYYFDTANCSLYLKTSAAKNEELQGALLHTYFSDYRKVDNVTFPFKMLTKSGDQTVLEVTAQNIKLNAEIKAEEFKPASLN